MKFAVLLALALSLQARADFIVRQRVENVGQQTGEVVVKLKDDKARTDLAPQVSNIIDGNTGEMLTLLHNQKSFMRIPAERAKELFDRMKNLQNAGKAPAKPVATGQKEKVEQWDAEIFTWSGGKMSARYWVAKDFPNAAALTAAMTKVQSAGVAALSKEMMPSLADFPGMVVKTEVKLEGKSMTSTIIAVEEKALDDKEFAPPTSYKEMPTPDFSPK